MAQAASYSGTLLSRTQNGKLRWYVMVMVAGIILLLTIMLNL